MAWQPTKYNKVKKVELDGIKFDSLKEMRMYEALRLLQRAKEIRDLEVHPKFELQPKFVSADGKNVRAITYTADFRFFDEKQCRVRIVDCKGWKTQMYLLKRKMFDYLHRTTDIYLEEEI